MGEEQQQTVHDLYLWNAKLQVAASKSGLRPVHAERINLLRADIAGEDWRTHQGATLIWVFSSGPGARGRSLRLATLSLFRSGKCTRMTFESLPPVV